jgi:hypothetical protein
MKGVDIAARACAVVGARFRPQGRSAREGIDCVGVAAFACGIHSERVRRNYALRGYAPEEIERQLSELGCRRVAGNVLELGDIALCRPGPAQYHLIVITPCGFVHADAGLRRVVQRPYPIPWTLVSAWRFAREQF